MKAVERAIESLKGECKLVGYTMPAQANTDFNDLARSQGIDAVSQHIGTAIEQHESGLWLPEGALETPVKSVKDKEIDLKNERDQSKNEPKLGFELF